MSEPASLIRQRELRMLAEVQRRLDEGETVLLEDSEGSRIWLDGGIPFAHQLLAVLLEPDEEPVA